MTGQSKATNQILAHRLRLIFTFSLLFALAFPAPLSAQSPEAPVSIVLKLHNPQGRVINNIDLPEFSFHFENQTEQFVLFETTPNFIVKTERLRFVLTSPDGKKHSLTPPVDSYRPADDGSNFTILYPGESTKNVRHKLVRALQRHFWEWWEDVLWVPGEYALAIAYVPDPDRVYGNPRTVQDSISSNNVTFTIGQTPEYLPVPPHVAKKYAGKLGAVDRGNQFEHVRYLDAHGQITAERIYIEQDDEVLELAFEIVYSKPLPATDSLRWRMVHKQLHTHGGSRHIPFWEPDFPHEGVDGHVRTWNYPESYVRRGKPLADARYVNGRLDGAFEAQVHHGNISAHYEAGKREGAWSVWRDTMLVFQAHFKADVMHGEYYLAHYRTGKPWKLGSYEDGLRHGIFETYHKNGQMTEHFEYAHDTVTGLAIWNDATGKELAKGMYLDGKPYNGTFFPMRPGPHVAGSRWGGEPKLPLVYRMGILQVEDEEK